MVVYAEEKSGLKDKVDAASDICTVYLLIVIVMAFIFLQIKFELTGSNLDKKDLFSESDPYFTISRMNPDGSDTLVYRSEWISNNASPEWAPVEITSGKLCNGDWNRNLRIEVYDHDTGAEDDYIGAFSTNLEEVLFAHDSVHPLSFDVNILSILNICRCRPAKVSRSSSGTLLMRKNDGGKREREILTKILARLS